MQLALAAGEREPRGDVQQLVAHPFLFGYSELAIQNESLSPDDQVVRQHHDLHQHFVHREPLERQLEKAGVLVVADAVLDACALTVTALQNGDVGVELVGEDRLEAVSVVVGERQLRAVCARSRRTITRAPVGQNDSSTRSVISTTCPFSRSDPS